MYNVKSLVQIVCNIGVMIYSTLALKNVQNIDYFTFLMQKDNNKRKNMTERRPMSDARP